MSKKFLIYVKLAAYRRRDQLDFIELIRAGADHRLARDYLQQHASDLLAPFDELLGEAWGEE